jgi:nitrogen fixation NifU-like protein
MRLHLKIGNNTVIEDTKFQYLGCRAVASSGSALTRIATGKTLEKAKKNIDQDVLHELKGLREVKFHCSKLAVTALKKAATKYENGHRKSSYTKKQFSSQTAYA